MPEFEWLVIDSTHCKIHLAVDVYDIPARIIITAGSRSDISQDFSLIQYIDAQFVPVDKAHNIHKFLSN